jgi:Secretion system C-terminal sorting domain
MYDLFGSNATYVTGCSYLQPFTASQPATLNSQTGLFTIYPNQAQSTIYSVQVSEYRQGVLYGTINRQVECYVYSCSNINPLLSGINGTTFYTDTFPANTTSCFNLFSSDSDITQTTQLSWDTAITNGVLTGDTSFNQIGTFCWTPLLSDTASNPHCFNVIVEDDNCPFTGSRSYNYCITVVDSGYILNAKNISEKNIDIIISPNPATNTFTIKNISSKEKTMVEIMNVLGEIVYQQEVYGRSECLIDAKLLAGVYFVRVGDVVRKLIVQ